MTTTIKTGDVVMLKSGGQPMTVVSLDGEDATCIWMGDSGDLFHQNVPVLAIALAELDDEEEEEHGHDDEEEDEEEEEAA